MNEKLKVIRSQGKKRLYIEEKRVISPCIFTRVGILFIFSFLVWQKANEVMYIFAKL